MLSCFLTPTSLCAIGWACWRRWLWAEAWFLPQGWLWAMRECHRGFLYLHFMPSHRVWPVFGETNLSWRDPGMYSPFQNWVTACRVWGCHWPSLPSSPPRPHPPWSYPLQEPPLWKVRVVLTGASLWYLKREYPLYVHFINGECTGETLICVSN